MDLKSNCKFWTQTVSSIRGGIWIFSEAQYCLIWSPRHKYPFQLYRRGKLFVDPTLRSSIYRINSWVIILFRMSPTLLALMTRNINWFVNLSALDILHLFFLEVYKTESFQPTERLRIELVITVPILRRGLLFTQYSR